ncbi:MAG: HAD-IIB family hydrolase [Gammaproteobacteria bacterium]|nr:HAD-IIB family hydrolase [Gammaproteobacteria bacterium]
MLNQYELTLATDLDGTFLEGDTEVKNFFYNKLTHLRSNIQLIYVTGRPIATVKQFCIQGYLPFPHYVIGDHGTHIVDGTTFSPVEHLQNPIIEKWNNANDRLKELLRDDKGIQLQPIDPPYRVAYYYEPSTLEDVTLQKIADAGCDTILSCDVYLDIVPKGVNKGSTLLQLLKSLDVNAETVITSGDSLNDLSLFQTGLKSIAVGNAEPKLLTAIKELSNVYSSKFPGLLGIIDGLKFFERMELFA